MEYARAGSLDEALSLLTLPGASVLAGGTDLVGQIDRGLAAPDLLVDISAVGLEAITPTADGGLTIGSTVTLARIASAAELAGYEAIATAASLAASPLLRNQGTVGGNLCQHTRCWYYRGVEWNCWLAGGDTCYAQLGEHSKHNLQPGDCISAHPSDLAPALAACAATLILRSSAGERELAVLDLYRRPSQDDRSLLTLQPGEFVAHIVLPAPPDVSTYKRLGERQAFSFPLVSVAAARRGQSIRVVANGIANIPIEIDPSDPLRDLPGNPQTGWKRHVLQTLVQRTTAAVG
jgi:xanthine dehydrogenase YagS FAD-binding subunit